MIDVRSMMEECGYEVRSYSGRGMMGRECLGFTTDDRPLEVAAQMIEWATTDEDGEEINELPALLRNMKQDAMGLSTIYYFPKVAWS